MKNLAKLITLLLLPLLLTQCKWLKNDPEPIDQLPEATQVGKNTFGCLLNGKVWTPKGFNGTSNYSVSYDPTYAGGAFDLRTYRYPKKGQKSQYFILYAFNLSSKGTYFFNNRSGQNSGVSFSDHKTNCEYASRDSLTAYSFGSITITKLDLRQGIIAGTFEFTLAKPGCDTIKVTEGRFDKKL